MFIDDYYNFVGEYPESHYRRELNNVYNKAQKAIGRNVADAEDDQMSEKDFAKERRKVVREQRKSEK